MAVNMEDVRLLEGLKLRSGAATAEVRILLSKSAMQATAISDAISQLQALLPKSATATAAAAAAATPTEEGGAAADAAAADAAEPLPMRLMRLLDSLRKQLHERATFLACLESTGIPTGPIQLKPGAPSDDDPPPEAGSLMEGVHAVRAKREEDMVAYLAAYYEAKGSRPPTRPTLIPHTLPEHQKKLEARLTGLITRAEEDRYQSVAWGGSESWPPRPCGILAPTLSACQPPCCGIPTPVLQDPDTRAAGSRHPCCGIPTPVLRDPDTRTAGSRHPCRGIPTPVLQDPDTRAAGSRHPFCGISCVCVHSHLPHISPHLGSGQSAASPAQSSREAPHPSWACRHRQHDSLHARRGAARVCYPRSGPSPACHGPRQEA